MQKILHIIIFLLWESFTFSVGTPPHMCHNKHEVLVPMRGSCNGFYICINGNAIASSCGNYYQFNAKLGVCDNPHNVACSVVETTPAQLQTLEKVAVGMEATSWTIDLCKTYQNGKLLPNLENCQEYYVCLNQRAYRRACPLHMHFNEALNVCQHPSLAGCKILAEERLIWHENCDNSSTKSVTWPHETDCRLYYGCSRKGVKEFICPKGLYYSASKERCEWPWNAECTQAENQNKEI